MPAALGVQRSRAMQIRVRRGTRRRCRRPRAHRNARIAARTQAFPCGRTGAFATCRGQCRSSGGRFRGLVPVPGPFQVIVPSLPRPGDGVWGGPDMHLALGPEGIGFSGSLVDRHQQVRRHLGRDSSHLVHEGFRGVVAFRPCPEHAIAAQRDHVIVPLREGRIGKIDAIADRSARPACTVPIECRTAKEEVQPRPVLQLQETGANLPSRAPGP